MGLQARAHQDNYNYYWACQQQQPLAPFGYEQPLQAPPPMSVQHQQPAPPVPLSIIIPGTARGPTQVVPKSETVVPRPPRGPPPPQIKKAANSLPLHRSKSKTGREGGLTSSPKEEEEKSKWAQMVDTCSDEEYEPRPFDENLDEWSKSPANCG